MRDEPIFLHMERLHWHAKTPVTELHHAGCELGTCSAHKVCTRLGISGLPSGQQPSCAGLRVPERRVCKENTSKMTPGRIHS